MHRHSGRRPTQRPGLAPAASGAPRAAAPAPRPAGSARGPASSRPTPATPLSDRQLGLLILPLRIFLGGTFLYAGLIKLLDPSFLDPSAPGSMVAQLHAFARDSPLSALIEAIGIPLATPIGLLIAAGELAVGIGAITGLAGRLAAWGGFAISALFFLTASWGTHPYFYGPDLPYAAGWLTLALIGDRGVHVARGWLDRQLGGAATAGGWSPERRSFIEAAVVGAAAVAAAAVGLARPGILADLLGASAPTGPSGAGSGAGPTDGASPGPTTAAAAPTAGTPAGSGPATVTTARSRPTATPAGIAVATMQDVAAAGWAQFIDPTSGDPGVVVRLPNGSYVAFDAVCTHAGCTVEYVPTDRALECPCHGAAFDPAQGGAVLMGPARYPLQRLPIAVDHATGQIRLVG